MAALRGDISLRYLKQFFQVCFCLCIVVQIRPDYVSNMAGVLLKAGTAYPSRAHGFTPVFGGIVLLSFYLSVLCCVCLCPVSCLPNVTSFSGLSIHS